MTDFIDGPETYRVYFKGEISPGTPIQIAKVNCSKLLKIEGEKLERMFSGREITLKKGINLSQSRHFSEVFRQQGLIVCIELEGDDKQDDSLSLEPLEKIERTQWKPKKKRSVYDEEKGAELEKCH